MRRNLISFIAILLVSCNDNHIHDGHYKSTVFTDASLSWVKMEELKLDGNELLYTARSAFDNRVFEEIKLECNQFPDHIEFKDKNGVKRIARFSESGDLQYGEYTYKKFDPNLEEDRKKMKKSKPLIESTKDGKIKYLQDKTINSLRKSIKHT